MTDTARKRWRVLQRLQTLVLFVMIARKAIRSRAAIRRRWQLAALQWKALKRLVEKELEWPVPIGWRQPFGWPLGFLSRSTILYGLGDRDPDQYVSDWERYVKTRKMVHARLQDVINNKLTTHLLLRALGLPTAELVGVYSRGRVHLFPAREVSPISDFLSDLAADERVFFKALGGAEGKNLFSVRRLPSGYRVNGQLMTSAQLARELAEGARPFVIERGVEQHPAQRALFEDTTNTLRLLTMIDLASGEPFVVGAVQRIGAHSSGPVDNWSQGGLSARVDIDTGRLSRATRLPSRAALDWFARHPDTNAQIEGSQVPHWGATVATVLRAAERASFLEYVGWDIIIGDDGPVILEANINSGMNVLQVHKPLLEDPRVRAYMQQRQVLARDADMSRVRRWARGRLRIAIRLWAREVSARVHVAAHDEPPTAERPEQALPSLDELDTQPDSPSARDAQTSPWLRARTLTQMLRRELEWKVPLSERNPGAWRRGFLSSSAAAYQLDRNEPGLYLSDIDRHLGSRGVVHTRLRDAINNKLCGHLLLRSIDVPSSPLIGVYYRGIVHRFPSAGSEDLLGFLSDLERGTTYFLKALGGVDGRFVSTLRSVGSGFRLDGELLDLPSTYRAITRMGRPLVIEEAVVPHAEQRELFPDAYNTIRLLTMLDVAVGQSVPIAAVQHVGTRASKPLDTWALGGLSAMIDLETGILGPATRQPSSRRAEWFDNHPDTDGPLRGRRVPHWDELLNMVREAAGRTEFLEYVEWDIIVKDDGPRVLEMNVHSGVSGLQPHLPLLSHPTVRAYLRDRGMVSAHA